eukprot:10226696-Lingulodinium_polyedra.AAC.1
MVARGTGWPFSSRRWQRSKDVSTPASTTCLQSTRCVNVQFGVLACMPAYMSYVRACAYRQ